jgi:hypothetical protein
MASRLLTSLNNTVITMISSLKNRAPAAGFARRSLVLGILSLMAAGAIPVSLRAQNAPQSGDAGAATQDNGNGNGNGRRGRRGGGNGNFNFSPEAMMENMRTQFGVTDDAEWAVISARITPVMEARRAAMTGMFGGFGGRGGGGFGGGGGNPDMEALRSAIEKGAPDADIKALLTRIRDNRKAEQAKLEKAQADLLAVLTVKQEAVAFQFGLVP